MHDAVGRPILTTPDLNRALREGLADAVGFVVGALAGWGLGRELGIDFIASPEWNATQIAGLALIVAGCGTGRWLARRLMLNDSSR
jgi:hypothetical protein